MHANLMLQFHYSALLGQQNVFSLPETFMLRFLLILEWHARRKNKHFYHLGILFSLESVLAVQAVAVPRFDIPPCSK